MPDTTKHIILRRTDERQRNLEEIAALIGKQGDTAVIDYALAFTIAHYRTTATPQPEGGVGEKGE